LLNWQLSGIMPASIKSKGLLAPIIASNEWPGPITWQEHHPTGG
jgi:hypothetical protein